MWSLDPMRELRRRMAGQRLDSFFENNAAGILNYSVNQ